MSESPIDDGFSLLDPSGPEEPLRPQPFRVTEPVLAAGMRTADGDREFHLLDYVRIVYRRRWSVLVAFLVVFGSVLVYSFTATPIYASRAQLLIESEDSKVVSFQEVLDQNKKATDYYQTQYRILQSRALAKRTMDAEKLWSDPQFGESQAPSGLSLNPLAWIAIVRGWASTRTTVDPGPPDAAETAAQSAAIDRFLSSLTIQPVRNSRLVDVVFESPRAGLSARVANALARNYISQNLEFKYTATKEATDWLALRMGEQRSNVERSELGLQAYREQNDAVSLEDRQNIVVQRLADLNAAVTKARTARFQKEAVYQQLRGAEGNRAALDQFPAVLANPFIQQLKGNLSELQRQRAQMADKFGDRHPEMIKIQAAIQSTDLKLDAEIGKVVQSLQTEYEAAMAEERSLMAALEQQKNEALALNRRAIEYGSLQRDAASNRQIFEGLLQRTKETDIASNLRTSNIRIVDEAEVPRFPARPEKLGNLVLGLFGGGILGLGLAFLFEYLDSRFKNPDDVKQHLGLPFLGMVPSIRDKDKQGNPLVNAGAPPQFVEAFRSLRTNVLFSSPDAKARQIVITSTIPGEGKTVVATNLALSLAVTGQRVLLIDADMRRPKAHTVFNFEQEPGLSNIIAGKSKASEAIQRIGESNCWFLPAGFSPPNPVELLGSRRFSDFLVSLSQHFEWVIIDSPPVMAVADGAVLSHVATGVVFVVGAEMATRGAVKAALEQLDAAKAQYVGAVLNKVEVQRHAYYYSHYYNKAYASYYQRDQRADV